MEDAGLRFKLPGRLLRAVAAGLSPAESAQVQIKGAFNEALVCTERRVFIVKTGFMTGQLFGSDIFQSNYSSITGVQVKYGLLSGYFELSAGGVQNTPKSYWSTKSGTSPEKAPNCVSITGKPMADRFRRACQLIMERVEATRQPSAPAPSQPGLSAELERLWALKTAGALSDAEFEAAKGKLIG